VREKKRMLTGLKLRHEAVRKRARQEPRKNIGLRSSGKQQRTWTPLVAELRRARDCVVKNAVYVWLWRGPDGATRLTRAVALAGALAPTPEMSQGLGAQ
jgi:hypothetical protein